MRLAWPRHFLGLPLHPMLVHFPLAFWLATPVLDAGVLLFGARPWWALTLGATGVGVAIGGLAVVTGLLDYVYLSETGSNDVRLAARHGVRTALVWCVMTVKLAVGLAGHAGPILVPVVLIVDLAACALLLQGGFFGTQITYGHHRRR